MKQFCTICNENYLPRALTLYRSLSEHCGHFSLYVLCLDHVTYAHLIEKPLHNIIAMRVETLEATYPELLQVRGTRSLIEYYFTCSASFVRYLLTHHAEIDLLAYLDADLYFFHDIQPVYAEMEGHSIGIIEHGFSPRHQHNSKFGIYNAGFVLLRNNQIGRGCAAWWSERCIEWCYDVCETGRHANQKYLDQWPKRFEGVRVIKHKGANVASWNLDRYQLAYIDGQVLVDGERLICFHFHGVKQLSDRLFDAGLSRSGILVSSLMRSRILEPYFIALKLEAHNRLPSSVRNAAAHRGRAFGTLRALMNIIAGTWSGSYVLLPRQGDKREVSSAKSYGVGSGQK